jgi:hypothetical protein
LIGKPRVAPALAFKSIDVPAALNQERAQLRTGTQMNRDLQADWKALGPTPSLS